MANAVSSVDCPLSIFGSWNTELSPPDLPEGGSPANNDVVYTPGAVATRPGVNRIFAVPVSSLGPFSYEKSFVTPSGVVKNLYLTKGDGKLWVEDVTNAPNVAVLLFQSAGATYASSCTAQGSEYIALSDGIHGADVPLQYDGANLWRLSQDGPAQPPTVQSVALPPSDLTTTSPGTVAVTSATPINIFNIGGIDYYTQLDVITAPNTFVPSQVIELTATTVSAYNGFINYIATVISPTEFYIPYLQVAAGAPTATGGFAGPFGTTLVRSNNTVTAVTATAHGLQKGFMAQISGVAASVVGTGISTIVLNNEDNPGIATVTTSTPHGLLPNNKVNIQGVAGTAVGTAITNVAFAGGLVTITTSTAHGLSVGSEVTVAAVTNVTVNGNWTVATVIDNENFTYLFSSSVTAYTAADTGTVTYLWPLANVDPSLNYFTVQTAPSDVTFTVQLSYTDGTWTGGDVSFAWDGIFFVTAILSATSFQYQQYGPDITTTAVGTVTPYGQAAPGIHQMRVSYLFANGGISAPSPPVTFVANGGQYLQINMMPIGPSNVAGRVLQFTGAGGAYYFYIPVPAQVNGLTVSTATQINDNISTTAFLDFSDNTLYAATAVSIPGNDLAAQVTLGPCAGMFSYASRLLPWSERNKVQNFLNLAFDADQSGVNNPQGWVLSGTPSAGVTVSLAARPPGSQWQMNTADSQVLSQSAYLDTFGAPILLPNITYKIRVWLKASLVGAGGPNFIATLSSASASYTSTATVLNSAMSSAAQGSFVEAVFSLPAPSTIPSDLLLNIKNSVTGAAHTLTVDELELIYLDQPYIPNQSRISYAENLTAFDAQTGIIGSQDDTSPIMNFGVIRQTLYMVTGTGLHETQDNGQTEPSGWTVDQVADNCGAFSIASVARNAQGIGSAGKDWMMWSGPDGAQTFVGGKPMKVSQEIQSVWDAIPAANAYQCWVKNYENAKWCFFGVPANGSMQVLVLDYRNIDGAAIAENPPIHISFTGKMIVSDLTRKWTVWGLPAWCGELMYRNTIAQPQIIFGCQTPSGGANAYVLNPAQYFDDDFGVIPASYTTYFFVSHEMEQALQVGSHRHTYKMAQAFISGVGTYTITPLAAALTNPFPSSPSIPLGSDPGFDVDFGINVETTRCAFMIQAAPTSGLDSYFKLQKLVINISQAPWAPTRGSGSGAF